MDTRISYRLKTEIYTVDNVVSTVSGSSISVAYPTIYLSPTASNEGYKSGYCILKFNTGSAYSEAKYTFGSSAYPKKVSFSRTGNATITTSTHFNASNPTTRSVRIPLIIAPKTVSLDTYQFDASQGSSTFLAHAYGTPEADTPISYWDVTLNAPPTFDSTQVSFDTPYVYAGFTTASVTISNLFAKYGGNIENAVLKIGNQTVSKTTDFDTPFVLSIPLNTGGTFTPAVTVTDSRGQVTTKNLNAITVNTYVTPSVLFSVERTLPTPTISTPEGEPYDEGESAVVTAKFDWTEVITTIAEPTIVVKDPNNLTVSVTKAWYKDRALTIPITDWSEITEDMQAYCLLTNAGHNAFNTQYSYQISLTPIDGLDGSGTTISQTLGSAFYTVDFLAGGHGIAFGQPASEEGFFCNMDATFKEDLVAQDMTTQEVQDFVDNLEGGGGSGTADRVVEQGTDGIWTYRKWASGIAECWGKTSVESYTYSANGGSKNIVEALPSGLFNATPNSVIASGRITTLVQTMMGFTSADSSNQVQTYLVNRGGSAVTQTGEVYWNVKGRWK